MKSLINIRRYIKNQISMNQTAASQFIIKNNLAILVSTTISNKELATLLSSTTFKMAANEA
jgi:hypothetical protein